ncbi:MAG: 6-hydroxycyclohex-1-ene-1-carbonyl-CoA dehydrogenase [Acidobacteriota bacterium]
MRCTAWVVTAPGVPMARETRDETPGPGEVLVEVAGCGVCHTDLGFYYHGVPTRHGFPLTLGHEISGTVVAAGPGAAHWTGRAVIVPAVLPCGECEACRQARGQVCPRQIFPGSDVHGGFATHVRLPSRGLCPVPDLTDDRVNPGRLDLASLSVIADAISTPYQAIVRSGLTADDLAVFVGAGGIGGFGVQIAAALGATVVAIDPSADRRAQMAAHGAALTLDPAATDDRGLRRQLRAFADSRGVPTWRTRIYETSGTTAGQATAFGLLGHGSYLSVIGYTAEPVELRFSNIMAFDATVQGNWGCLPDHYPAVLSLVLSGRIALEPFIERRPLAAINEVFAELHAGRPARRMVLMPGMTNDK